MSPAQTAAELLEHAHRDLVHAEAWLQQTPGAGPEVLATEHAAELTAELLRMMRAVFL